MVLVLFAQDQLRRIEDIVARKRGPLDAYIGVVPHETTFVTGPVHIVALVAELSEIGQNQETVREPARDEELTAILRRKPASLQSI